MIKSQTKSPYAAAKSEGARHRAPRRHLTGVTTVVTTRSRAAKRRFLPHEGAARIAPQGCQISGTIHHASTLQWKCGGSWHTPFYAFLFLWWQSISPFLAILETRGRNQESFSAGSGCGYGCGCRCGYVHLKYRLKWKGAERVICRLRMTKVMSLKIQKIFQVANAEQPFLVSNSITPIT